MTTKVLCRADYYCSLIKDEQLIEACKKRGINEESLKRWQREKTQA